METFRTSAFVLRLGGIFLLAAFTGGLHMMYRRGVRRFEKGLDNTYSQRFERQAIIAKSLHTNLAQTIQRSKFIVDQVRESSPEGPEMQAALNQVSHWLEGAAGESDRALRSLEGGPLTTLNQGFIARGAYVDSKTDSHHDC